MVPMMIMILVVAIALTPSCILDSCGLASSAFATASLGSTPAKQAYSWLQKICACHVSCHACSAPGPLSPSSAVPEGATQAQHFISFMTTNRR